MFVVIWAMHARRIIVVQRPKPLMLIQSKHIHANVHATYGSRRMQAELNAQGFVVGRYKVRSLM